MLTLSCAMIVRDNEATLERALQSVRPHVDELVIVDTGSSDNTCEIASRYADLLIGFEWCDDFSAARNYAFEQCSGDWIMWMDSDDELFGGEHLRRAINDAPPDMGALLLSYVTDRAPDGKRRMEFWRERLVRNGWFRWFGRAHEVLDIVQPSRYMRFEDAWVEHRGHNTPEHSLARNIRLLELDLAENPTNTRTLFYLGRDLVTRGDLDRGREILERYMGLAVWPDEAFIAQTLIGFCHRAQRRYGEAYESDLKLLTIHADWPQAWFCLAEDCYYLQRWEWGVLFCHIGRCQPPPETNLFISREAIEYNWMIFQVVSLYRVGNLQAAYDLTLQALSLHPDDQMHQYNKRTFEAELSAPQIAAVS